MNRAESSHDKLRRIDDERGRHRLRKKSKHKGGGNKNSVNLSPLLDALFKIGDFPVDQFVVAERDVKAWDDRLVAGARKLMELSKALHQPQHKQPPN